MSDGEWLCELGDEVSVGKEPLYRLPLIPPRAWLGDLPEPLATLYATGLRAEEYLGLRAEQVSGQGIWLDDRFVPVDRPIPLGLPIELEAGRLQALFAASGRRLTAATFRHAYATHRLEDGMPLASLGCILGHQSVMVTLQYLETAVGLRRADYEASHPLRLGRGAKADGFTLAEYEALVEAAERDEERLIFRLLFASGLRLSELLGLGAADVQREEGKLFVRSGKGDKDRYVLVDRETVQALPEVDPLFSVSSATPIATMVRRAAQKAGLLEKYSTVSPHSFRRSFATQCYLNGMPPATLKSLLGHEKLESTRIYLDIPWSHLEAAYQAL